MSYKRLLPTYFVEPGPKITPRGPWSRYLSTGADDTVDTVVPTPETDSVVLQRIDTRTLAIADQQKSDADSRRLTVIIGAVGALFAALKLGIIAIPHVRRHFAESNPSRRRRRRRQRSSRR
jgi:hypothetical protein